MGIAEQNLFGVAAGLARGTGVLPVLGRRARLAVRQELLLPLQREGLGLLLGLGLQLAVGVGDEPVRGQGWASSVKK